jgi:hypothetical protein
VGEGRENRPVEKKRMDRGWAEKAGWAGNDGEKFFSE